MIISTSGVKRLSASTPLLGVLKALIILAKIGARGVRKTVSLAGAKSSASGATHFPRHRYSLMANALASAKIDSLLASKVRAMTKWGVVSTVKTHAILVLKANLATALAAPRESSSLNLAVSVWLSVPSEQPPI
jgi:hypothetical protein